MLEGFFTAVQGGVSTIGNLWKNMTGGISNFASGFFPATQKVTTVPAITAPAGASPNAGYRTGVLPQMATLGEQWFETPVTTQFKPSPIKVAAIGGEQWLNAGSGLFTPAETGGLQTTLDKLFAGMESAAKNVGTFKSLADSIMGAFTKHKPIVEGPDGTVVTNIEPTADMSSSVGTYLTGVNQAVSDMVKGLFNLGYSGPQGPQPTVPVQGEFAGTKTYTTLIVGAIIVVLIIWWMKRK
jgi:hypothetical protein